MSKIFIPDKDRRLFTLEDAIAAANQYMNPELIAEDLSRLKRGKKEC